MVLLVAVVIVGGLATFAVLFQFGALTALVIAPFGGSFSALLAGLLLGFRRAEQKRPVKAISRGQRQRLKPAPSRAAPAWRSMRHHAPF
jgi:hypothetical protein